MLHRLIPCHGHRQVVLGSIALLLSTPVWAGNPQEDRELTLALKQLENVQAIITRAENQARFAQDTRSSRYEFNYELLKSDLTRVSAGIQSYLYPSRAQPRDLGDVAGEYSQERNTR